MSVCVHASAYVPYPMSHMHDCRQRQFFLVFLPDAHCSVKLHSSGMPFLSYVTLHQFCLRAPTLRCILSRAPLESLGFHPLSFQKVYFLDFCVLTANYDALFNAKLQNPGTIECSAFFCLNIQAFHPSDVSRSRDHVEASTESLQSSTADLPMYGLTASVRTTTNGTSPTSRPTASSLCSRNRTPNCGCH